MENQEIVIDKSNFNEYFFEARYHRPQPGQCLACFRALAVFGSGSEKWDIINLLKIDKAYQASQVMQKIHRAKPPDCYRVLREMCEDLLIMTEEEVESKEYEFMLEIFYYTKREYVPKNDPHWELLPVLQYDAENNTFKTTIEI